MIILNTTFFAEAQLEEELTAWLKETYIPAIEQSKLFGEVETVKVIEPTEEGAVSLACRCCTPKLETARQWHDDTAVLMHDDLRTRWQGRVLWFTTYMERL